MTDPLLSPEAGLSSPFPLGRGGEERAGVGNPQLDLYAIIDDIDTALAAFPVRVPGYVRRRPNPLGNDPDPAGVVVLHVAGDAKEYTRVTIACPEGWTVASTEAGMAHFDTPDGPMLPNDAVRQGLVVIAACAGFVDRAVTRQSFERWGGKG